MVSELLEEPWDKGEGRPRELTLRQALVVTAGYLRQNIIEDVWADIFGVVQSAISRYITFLTPLIEKATEEDRPTAEDAAEATRDAIALVDGTLWPCWSWDGERKLWSGKYKTTGHGSLIVSNLQGRVTFVSDPVTGNQHDMAKLKGSDAEMILKRAGGVFGDKGFIGTDYITAPIRKPEFRKLLQWEHQWNNQVAGLRRTGRRGLPWAQLQHLQQARVLRPQPRQFRGHSRGNLSHADTICNPQPCSSCRSAKWQPGHVRRSFQRQARRLA